LREVVVVKVGRKLDAVKADAGDTAKMVARAAEKEVESFILIRFVGEVIL